MKRSDVVTQRAYVFKRMTEQGRGEHEQAKSQSRSTGNATNQRGVSPYDHHHVDDDEDNELYSLKLKWK